MSGGEFFFTCLVFLAIVGGIFTLGIVCGLSIERQKAIEYGAAKWVADEKTGEVSFVYGK